MMTTMIMMITHSLKKLWMMIINLNKKYNERIQVRLQVNQRPQAKNGKEVLKMKIKKMYNRRVNFKNKENQQVLKMKIKEM